MVTSRNILCTQLKRPQNMCTLLEDTQKSDSTFQNDLKESAHLCHEHSPVCMCTLCTRVHDSSHRWNPTGSMQMACAHLGLDGKERLPRRESTRDVSVCLQLSATINIRSRRGCAEMSYWRGLSYPSTSPVSEHSSKRK